MLTRARGALAPSQYRAYVDGPAWVARKRWWRDHRSARRRRCQVCRSTHYDLHHRTYVRLGRERLRDLVPLCRRHHERLHRFQRARGWTVERASRWYLGAARARRAALPGLLVVALVLVLL